MSGRQFAATLPRRAYPRARRRRPARPHRRADVSRRRLAGGGKPGAEGAGGAHAPPGTEVIELDARDTASVIEVARGADVVLNALNVPFTQWATAAVPLAETAIAAARENGATLVFPGTLYGYGTGIPAILDETTPMRPTSRKGEIRVAVEARLRETAEQGTRVIILRSGDFFGSSSTGSYFDRLVIRDINEGAPIFSGPLDVVHEWAYVPDLCEALRRLVEARAGLEPFAQFGFPGHAATGRVFVSAISRACGRGFKVAGAESRGRCCACSVSWSRCSASCPRSPICGPHHTRSTAPGSPR